ncbi:amidohydrolase family protein [Tabrizicola aquatica]|uniref:amidohydrolase family protein n=1 Tax=Tabrizicola aquatica TaxID=909926 RepID=UPI000CD1CA95|nr:amidohydrolase [Tabrizicola aquatica]
MQLIDSHQHLILRDRLGYAWADAIAALTEGDFSPDDYARLTEGRGVVWTIFMETGVDDADYQAEARLVAGMVGQRGMLGQIASIRPEAAAGFDAWLEEAAGLGVVGFRRILHVVPDAVSQSATFVRNLRRLGRAGYSFDLTVLSRQLLPVALPLSRACPDQVFILDHCGVSDIAGGDWEMWEAGVATVAAHPNVFVKLSGITAYCAPGTATVATVQPYVKRLLDLFGPDRMLWGSDWPVVDLGAGLPGWIDMTGELLAGLSIADRRAIGHKTARRVYRLPRA